jgi:hypothetical protein
MTDFLMIIVHNVEETMLDHTLFDLNTHRERFVDGHSPSLNAFFSGADPRDRITDMGLGE